MGAHGLFYCHPCHCRAGLKAKGNRVPFPGPQVRGLGGPLRSWGLGPLRALGWRGPPTGLPRPCLPPPPPPATCHWPGGRHMLSELLNRKSASRSSQGPFHVVSLIPQAGFQKRFTVSVLQSYAPFNVGVFQEVGGERLQSKHVCFTSASCRLHRAGRGGAATWPPGLGPGGYGHQQGEPLSPTYCSPPPLPPCQLPFPLSRPTRSSPQPVGPWHPLPAS